MARWARPALRLCGVCCVGIVKPVRRSVETRSRYGCCQLLPNLNINPDRACDGVRCAARLEVRPFDVDQKLPMGRARACCQIPPRSPSTPRCPSQRVWRNRPAGALATSAAGRAPARTLAVAPVSVRRSDGPSARPAHRGRVVPTLPIRPRPSTATR